VRDNKNKIAGDDWDVSLPITGGIQGLPNSG